MNLHSNGSPTLKTAPIFGGIAGIIGVEQAEQDDSALPTSRKLARDTGEMQDLYRRALTASYSCPDWELPADECIEDIFAGGDGWGRKAHKVTFQAHRERESEDESVSPKRRGSGHARNLSQESARMRKDSKAKKSGSKLHPDGQHSSSSDDHKKIEDIRDRDIPENELREDLRSWHISAR